MNSSKGRLSLTGQWHGTFAYPQGLGPATPFIANLRDYGGKLHGEVSEPDTIYQRASALAARLTGHRAGRSVDFVKVYVGAPGGYENPVDYVGQLSADGQSITGVWSLLDLDGTFEMFRESAASEPLEVKEEEAVPIERF